MRRDALLIGIVLAVAIAALGALTWARTVTVLSGCRLVAITVDTRTRQPYRRYRCDRSLEVLAPIRLPRVPGPVDDPDAEI